MKFAYIGIDLFLPALQILLDENQELVELFTCETDDLTEFHDGVTALAVARGVPVTTEPVSYTHLKTAASFADHPYIQRQCRNGRQLKQLCRRSVCFG